MCFNTSNTSPYGRSTNESGLNFGASSSTSKQPPIHLILDFDSTITHEDTTSVLAGIACERLTQTQEQKWDHCRRWEICCQKYTSEKKNYQHLKEFKKARTTLDEEISFLRSMRVVEEASVSRVGQSGIFRGVPDWAWREEAWRQCQTGRVNIRKGFRKLVEKVQDQRGGLSIVSVNWSRDFLKGVLGFSLGGDGKAESIPVLSNRVIAATGFIEGPKFGPGPRSGLSMVTQPSLKEGKLLLSCDDKLEAMKCLRDSFEGSIQDQIRPPFHSIRARLWEEEPPEKISAPLILYVGDSLTDIECLLEADIGIVMNFKGNGTLIETLGRCNVNVLHVSFWEPQPGKSIWFARDFQDILDCRLFTRSAAHIPME